jgi:DNA-binding PadR family transcriptional regulator
MYLEDMKRRESSTRWAVLGALTLGPMSGYDIRRHAGESWGHFWSESYGQIYPTLRALEAEGLVRPAASGARANQGSSGSARGASRAMVSPPRARDAHGRERRSFVITPRGRAALRRWQAEPSPARPPRNELLLKLFFGANADPAALVSQIERVRTREQEALQRWNQLERVLRHEHAAHANLPFWLATLSFGRHHSDALVRWCEETLAELARAPRPAGARRRAVGSR